MAGLLKLFVDVESCWLMVSSRVRSPLNPSQLPPFVQSDTVPIELYLYDHNQDGGLQDQVHLITSPVYSPKVALVTLHPVTPTTHAQVTLTADASVGSTGKYTGSLALGAAIDTLLGATATSATATLQIQIGEGSNTRTVALLSCIVKAHGITTGIPDSVPGVTFPSWPEANATFVKRAGLAGESFKLVSPDGTKSAIIYWGDDNSLNAEALT